MPGINRSWTPIKPITITFAVGRNRTAQVVQKQFPLWPAAAKTIHRSQGDTEKKIVVNFATKRAIPHIHYIVLSRVTTIDCLYVTDLCEKKMVKTEMESLRKERYLQLSITPVYKLDQVSFKICFLNARSMHRHIDDVQLYADQLPITARKYKDLQDIKPVLHPIHYKYYDGLPCL